MCALSQIENAPQRQSVNACLVLGYWGEKFFCRILVANLVAGGGSTREENVQQWANIKNTDKNLPSSILMEKMILRFLKWELFEYPGRIFPLFFRRGGLL